MSTLSGSNCALLVIGLGGVTCGGKTTLAKRLKREFSSVAEMEIISQDDYYLPTDCLTPISDLNYWNFDIPDAIDWAKFKHHIDQTVSVSSASESNEPTVDTKQQKMIVVVEGNLIFATKDLFDAFDRRFFFTMTYDECRNVRNSRLYDPPDAVGYFDTVVWPEYHKHEIQAKNNPRDYIFLEANNYESNFAALSTVCRQFLFVDWILITNSPLSTDNARHFVTSPTCGAISIFLGTTRNEFNGKKVTRLEYEAYGPMAQKQIQLLCDEARHKWSSIKYIAIHHRLGVVPVAECSVVIAVSTPHRADSQKASKFLIDKLKEIVPIWKKEIYEDDSKAWKENKECPWRQHII